MRILVASTLDPATLRSLSEAHDVRLAIGAPENQLVDAIGDREALVFRSGVDISRTVLSAAPDLRLLIRAGSGLDNLDVDYARSRRMTLVRVPGPGAQAVAELAFGLMIHLAREIRWNDQELRQGRWTKSLTKGYTLRGKVLGIVGAGNIGSRVGEMGSAWGMKPIGCVESPTETARQQLADAGIQLAGFREVVSRADFLTIHVPKQPSTIHLIDRTVLSWMKPTSFLVNLARGGVVDEAALLHALQGEQGPAGAALDVHVEEGEGKISPLAALSNVILTPHIGATTVDTQRQIGERVSEIIASFDGASDTFPALSPNGPAGLVYDRAQPIPISPTTGP